jgi:hypothetical protein
MKERAGRTSSPLDTIHAERWTTGLTDELLALIWVVERTIEIGAAQEALLDRVLDSELVLASDVGEPRTEARKPPALVHEQVQLDGFDVDQQERDVE